MGAHRLLEALTHIDPGDADRIFGARHSLVAPGVELAPTQRVALFAEAFFPKIDGVSKSAYLTLRYLQQTGREVLVFAPDIAPQQIGGARVIPLPSLGFPNVPETRVAFPHPRIWRELHAFKPDLIHLFSPASLMSAAGALFGRAIGVPVIGNYQTDLPGYGPVYGFPNWISEAMRGWLRSLHNLFHLTLAPSRTTQRQLRGWGFKRLRTWGRGVDAERYSPNHAQSAMRARLLNGRDPNALLCVYAGRLATEKRIDLLLDVATLPGVALTIIGDGAEREALETLFAGTGTHFTGYLFGEELSQAFASADVFLFTGAHETFGQVVQEALASGLPAIVIDQGGVVDLVEHGVNGYWCEADPAAFAAAVMRLRDDPALRQRLSQEARRRVENNTWPHVLGQLESYYREALTVNRRLNAKLQRGKGKVYI